MYRAGLCAILSQLAREDRLAVVEQFTVDSPKTKLLAQKLKGMGLSTTCSSSPTAWTTTCGCPRATCRTSTW